jgi:hypothetical protein
MSIQKAVLFICVAAGEIISRQRLKGPETIKPLVAINLEARLLDACVGEYDFAPSAVFPTGATLTIWREGDRLLAQPRIRSETPGALDIPRYRKRISS